MAWRVARGLNTLLAQINEIAPNRSVASDGSIGDLAHRASPSDHNPDTSGVVRARDFTHDPGHGADMRAISERLRLSRDRRISYVIFNRRIFSATNHPWTWRPYTGPNPHDHHMHVSVVATSVADDTSDWKITEDDMALTDKLTTGPGKGMTLEQVLNALLAAGDKPLPLPDQGVLPDGSPLPAGTHNRDTRLAYAHLHSYAARQLSAAVLQLLTGVRADLAAALGRDPVDEEALAAILWARLPVQDVDVIARVLREGMPAGKLAELAARLAAAKS